MDIHLLIDDLRVFDGIDHTARTPYEGLQFLRHFDVTHLYIDHDLGLDSDGTEYPNGYNVICWAIEERILPRNVTIVSSNPVGRSNIERALQNEGYRQYRGSWYKD